uniref:NADH dehydrogenase subunit 2 n=1 Tax=Pyramimonas parkeae TaxID=36894 RepID=A0A1D8I1S0_9CHLO|nr:NADH dehydrogenase subunit 2 [Pyramimonas parkeae]YP_009310495.1 NADH dehydrogenase subunit 2 [Pyramimonas parkeae]AOT98928.1 NADH dehydrogenase subunit 2 [Pyramimonas parkeae]AOT98930.1 NADH dehydrogenase subunit 2 [Pyramimonas parkeae]
MKELFLNDFKLAIPELFLISISIFLLVYGVIYSTSDFKGYPILSSNISRLALVTLCFSIILVMNHPIEEAVFFSQSLILDDFSSFLKVLILICSFTSILISLDYLKEEKLNSFEPIILILISTGSMLLMVSSYDFLSMYLGIELQSLCFYVLAACKRDSEFSTEAGIKYFLLGAFSSGLLLFGCSLIYGFTGLIHFEELAKVFSGIEHTNAIKLGILFLAVGFLFKLTAVPFHMWAPDVYEGAPNSITAFFLITPKIAILGLFVRLFLYSFYDFLFSWQVILLISSIASMILACFAAMAQKKIKRLLVYSAIGHVGYMLLAFSCGNLKGIQALFLYLVIYLIMTINMFASILSLRHVKYIGDLHQLVRTNPLLSITMGVNLFSIAGIPPLAGFCSKFYLFFAALSSSLYLGALVGVLTSVISCFYYIRLIKIIYFESPKTWIYYSTIDKEKSLILAITSFFILFFFSYPSPLFIFTHKIALAFII